MPSVSQRSSVRISRPSSAASSCFVKKSERIASGCDIVTSFVQLSAQRNHVRGHHKKAGNGWLRWRGFPVEPRRPELKMGVLDRVDQASAAKACFAYSNCEPRGEIDKGSRTSSRLRTGTSAIHTRQTLYAVPWQQHGTS